jgi:hypothetical protein
MSVRHLLSDDAVKLGTAKVTISTATTTNFDFGTPNDIDLKTLTSTAPGYGYPPGGRIIFVMTASTAGTTDSLTFSVQDAPDDAGSIGTPATAVTDLAAASDALAATTGDAYVFGSVQVQPGRPWLRFRVASNGTTDTFVCHCTVYALPRAL